MDNLLPHLHGFRTIAFDPPGIGRSQMAAWPLSLPALARLGIAVLDELGIDSAHLLGQSFGGALAQQTAISHPARVRRLVLASTTFGGFAWPGDPQAFWHFIHPRTFHPQRLERVAGDMFGGRLRTEPGLDDIGRYRISTLFGAPAMCWGETVVAIVALGPGQTLTLVELREFAGQSLARYKIPTKLFMVPTMPRNPAGKVLKVQLRQEFRATQ